MGFFKSPYFHRPASQMAPPSKQFQIFSISPISDVHMEKTQIWWYSFKELWNYNFLMTSIISIRLRNNETQAWYSKVLLQLNLLVIACLTPIKMSIAKGNSCNLEVWFGCPTFRPDFCPFSYGGTIQSIYYALAYELTYELMSIHAQQPFPF